MKKIFLFLFLFLFLFVSGVSAKTNSGVLYTQYWREAGVNVFAKSNANESMDYQGWQVKSTSDDNIYYCIEPEVYMQNLSNGKGSTHVIYDNKSSIISNSRLNENTFKRVNLLAYYGYQYKNHDNKKWYGITQVMIWNLLRKDLHWSFKTSRYGSVNNNLFVNEVKELNDLVDSHYVVPNFSDKTIVVNEEYTFVDSNNVLDNFDVGLDNDNIRIFKDGNKLIVRGLKEGNTKITLTKKMLSDTKFLLFSGGNLQDLVTRGKVDPVSFSFNVNVVMGKVVVSKVDEDGNIISSDNPSKVLYNLYDENDNLVEEVLFDEDKKTILVPFGKYYFKEINAPMGYMLDDKKIYFTIDNNNINLELKFVDKIISSEVEIFKYKDGPLEDLSLEENAKFLITGKDFSKEVVTDKNGYVKFSLPFGKYKVEQINGEEGYNLVSSFIINVTDGKKMSYNLINYRPSEVIIKKVDKSDNRALGDAVIGLYNEEGLIYKSVTDKDGLMIISDLEKGHYYLMEEKAPLGYIRDASKHYFDVLEDGKLINIEISNEKFVMPDTYKSCDFSYLFLGFIILGFVLLRKYD